MARDDRPADPAPLGSLLSGAAGRFGVDDAGAVGTVWRKWLDLVGPDVAAHCEPTSLRAGVLRVRADSPVWAHEVGYLSEEIKGRVNRLLGRDAVREVRIWSGPSKTGPQRDRNRPAGGSEAPGAEPPEPLPDDPLTALERARGAWLSKRRSGGP